MTFKKVFVIDDEKFDRLLYKRVIDKTGLVDNLVLFGNAEDALAAVRTDAERPELILLDINMPRMNGFEFLEEIDQELAVSSPPTTVAMLTTSANPKDAERANQFASVKYFFNKPLKSKMLTQIKL